MNQMGRIESRVPGVSRFRSSRGGAGKVILGIIGGLIALVVLVVLVTVWVIRNYVVIEITENDDGTSVEISTPFGDLALSEANATPEDLGLPLYPGAEPTGDGGSVSFHGGEGEEVKGGSFRSGEFRVRAELDEVDEWYRAELGEEYERKEGDDIRVFNQRDWPGEVKIDIDGILYVRERGTRLSGVVLERHGRRVEISLFEVIAHEPI